MGGQACQLPQPIAGLSGSNAVRRGVLEGVLSREASQWSGAWLCDGLCSQPIVSEDGERNAACVTTEQ